MTWKSARDLGSVLSPGEASRCFWIFILIQVLSKENGDPRNIAMNTLRSVLVGLEREGVALGHFNVADLLLLKAILAAAAEIRVPVLVGASEGERHFFGT